LPRSSQTVLAALLWILAACGGTTASTPGSAAVTGTVNGVPFLVPSALSVVGTTGKGSSGFIVLTSDAGLCGQLESGHRGKGQQRLEMAVYTVDSSKLSHAASVPGTYSLNMSSASGLFAEVDYLTEDDSCQQVVRSTGKAASGEVVITSVEGGLYTGTFSVALLNGEELRGSFAPTECAAAERLFTGEQLVCE